MNYKNIHIGSLISQKVQESSIKVDRIVNFFKCDIQEIQKMYEAESLDTKAMLSWCKLLKCDFFRIYSHHLILYAPPQKILLKTNSQKEKSVSEFRKNVYTVEIIEFIVEKITSGKMTKLQVINRYNIPKTTLYKWVHKYNNKVVRSKE